MNKWKELKKRLNAPREKLLDDDDDDDDDDDNLDEEDSKKLHELVKEIKRRNTPQPIIYWWYDPVVYWYYDIYYDPVTCKTRKCPASSVFFPQFNIPLLPYVEINMSSAFLG
jgi:hypothetical protein